MKLVVNLDYFIWAGLDFPEIRGDLTDNMNPARFNSFADDYVLGICLDSNDLGSGWTWSDLLRSLPLSGSRKSEPGIPTFFPALECGDEYYDAVSFIDGKYLPSSENLDNYEGWVEENASGDSVIDEAEFKIGDSRLPCEILKKDRKALMKAVAARVQAICKRL